MNYCFIVCLSWCEIVLNYELLLFVVIFNMDKYGFEYFNCVCI